MSKKKVFLSFGAFVLFIAGAWTIRASHKYTIQGLFFTCNGVCARAAGDPNLAYFVTSGTNQATITTETVVKHPVPLYATSTCQHKIYFSGCL